MKVFKKILSVLFSIFVFGVLVAVGDTLIETNLSKNNLPTTFGMTPVQVLSPSMTESGIEVGSVHFVIAKDSYEVGDIVAFNHGSNIIFHEIVSYNSETQQFQTKGSSNSVNDPFTISSSDIIGYKIGFGISYPVFLILRLLPIFAAYSIAMYYIIMEIYKTIKESADEKQSVQVNLIRKGYNNHNQAIVRSMSLLFLACLFGFSETAAGVQCSAVQSAALESYINYVIQIDYSNVIHALQELSKDDDSYLSRFFNGLKYDGSGRVKPKPIGSCVDSSGKNWAPYVNSELAEILGVNLDEVTSHSWTVIKTFFGYDIYYTESDLTKMSKGEKISKVYRYDALLDEFSYSAAYATRKISEKGQPYIAINALTYDIINRTIIE